MRWLLTPAVLVVAVFAAALSALLRYSVLEFVPGSLVTGGLTVANFTGIMSRQYLGAVWDTVLLSAATTALTLVASYPVAYVLARTPSARVRSALLVLTLAPFFTGAIVRTYAWVLVLGNTVVTWPIPMLFTPRGVLVGLVHFSMPTMILLLAAAISHVDPVYERAAASLGATPARVFRRVTLPLSMPGVISGCVLVFASSTTAFISQSIIGGNRLVYLTLLVWQESLVVYNWPLASVAALTLLILVTGAIAAISLLGRRCMRHLHA